MSSLLPISTILQVADISQYLAANDISQGKKLKSGFLAPDLSVQIFNAKTVVRWIYSLNTSDASLTQTSNYLFQLLAGYVNQALAILGNVAGGLATISNPANQSVNVGQSATFSVTVTSSSPFSLQWYKNGIAIPGATGLSYTLSNAQLSDSGSTFFAVATNAAGPITSGVAVLTVTAVLTGFFSYQSSDPAATLQASSDPFTYQESFSITNGQPWVMPVPGPSTPNMYIIVKGPIGQPIKTAWNNGGVNIGLIPDLNWHPTLAFGGFQYYYTHLFSLDPLQTLTLS